MVGNVEYLDFDNDDSPFSSNDPNIVVQAFQKRSYFKGDSETRIVINPFSNIVLVAESKDQRGISVPVDLNSLITEIRVAPGAAPWYRETVRSVCDRFELQIPIESSQI